MVFGALRGWVRFGHYRICRSSSLAVERVSVTFHSTGNAKVSDIINDVCTVRGLTTSIKTAGAKLSTVTNPRLSLLSTIVTFPSWPAQLTITRTFESGSEYNNVADETLEAIQDSIDDVLESRSVEYELTNASGVLTLSLPPHGTWVINKQSPNQQLWWSSPLSGPKRFEYRENERLWFSTKEDGLNLGRSLVQEIRQLFPHLKDFELNV